MPKRITEPQRQTVLHMLAQGMDRETIAASVGLTPGQVSAVAAHVRMGTYQLPNEEVVSLQAISQGEKQTKNLLRKLHNTTENPAAQTQFSPILLGVDAETNEEVFWNPNPESGSPNPHVLILGESGFGKTYTTACLLA